MDSAWDRSRGIIRQEISFRLELMGFNPRDVMLRLPLQAVWTALEEMDRRISTHANEMSQRKNDE